MDDMPVHSLHVRTRIECICERITPLEKVTVERVGGWRAIIPVKLTLIEMLMQEDFLSKLL